MTSLGPVIGRIRKEMSGTNLGPGPLELKAVVIVQSIKLVDTRNTSERVGENGLHVLSETIGRFRDMLFTWY
ncbi:hypothetical protein N7491_007685 [Penicillium cf. griseofulvum]|uniref:Uncharacterized protein n=1 Tax=Penicillium cf. griseofulvum TaxID=2972120 RepID=A0A9W9M0F9_9EURO|nr:hypothetical protein N7472_009290 [Penicillium cf. griseofulvum]KAJ5430669.1 hypothetical protein N7491_007685 [Penicillium cf. griseofulvum]KAJ5435563.1 hypothetical protein N7445_006448 [Penicillium cf. griseofulvum]